ncbi:hypothetical protein QBC40DRAFT_60763 [Triangularia verruculosa]|uniref:Uncharacterized protein n=1 Tax=Triangularia verruculosa TaxID=2587418 RepID=A0AAN7AWH5_9PEZI|nr:hypothetical protein QBC40DRAFT_60763 [Triangularia verruculosa]
MAATPFDPSVPGDSFIFDIYTDGQTLRAPTPATFLPGGPCNYTDSALPRCGCRRFWSNSSLASTGTVEICMCSHHACFHEDVQPGQTQTQLAQTQSAPVAGVLGQENQKPRSHREPLSPVQELANWPMPASFGASLDLNLLDFQNSAPNPRIEATTPLPVAHLQPAHDSPMPDTFDHWGDLIETQADNISVSGLPPIPAQCLLAQGPPSTASSSQARYLRPFAGRGLQTLNAVPTLREEVARPGVLDDDPTQEHDPMSRREREETPKASQSQVKSSKPDADSTAYQKLTETVESHEQRIDRLENTSFSVAGHEECHDKHEHTDMRVTELESRVDEVEKMLNDNGSVVGSRRHVRNDTTADDATASVVSVATNTTITTSNRVEVYNQIQRLQAQVNQLQAAAPPTYAKPWELEVVFMPFPLKGVWVQANEFPIQRRSLGAGADAEWTQMQNTLSRATPDPQSPKFAEWPGQSSESNWLLPRAFASGRIIDQRLRSRGLIKTVLVKGADARSVQLAIHDAFSEVLRVSALTGVGSDYSPNSPLNEFMGLRQAWVPLRKLHKDSRLRFLTPAEMATPALWDFTFLGSSVIMKATGVHRLYITQPEAYLQDHPLGYHALDAGWTWQKLRELSRFYPDSQSTASDVPEADAMEDCWAWNDRVDEPPSHNASVLNLRHSHLQRLSRRSSTEPSQQFYTGVQSPMLSNGQSFIRAGSPLTQRERKGSRPPQFIRAGSVPAGVLPAHSAQAFARRRVSTAAPHERRSSPLISRPTPRVNTVQTSGNATKKRRLGTRSPSLVPRNTPRWSMSRSPSLAPPGMFGHYEERDRTPFCYATPHSEVVGEHGYPRGGSRGPPQAMLRNDGYDPDDDEDEEMTDDFQEDDTQGSSTDPYDSEMTNDVSPAKEVRGSQGSFGFGTDGEGNEMDDIDIDVYEDDEEDELDGVETDHTTGHQRYQVNSHAVWGNQAAAAHVTRPEDIPRAGIEDQMSDGENVDPSSSFSSFASDMSGSFHSSQSRQQEHAQQQEIEIHQDEDEEDGAERRSNTSARSSQAPSEYSSRPGPWNVLPPPSSPVRNNSAGSTAIVAEQQEAGVKAQPIKRERSSLNSLMDFRIHEDRTAQS